MRPSMGISRLQNNVTGTMSSKMLQRLSLVGRKLDGYLSLKSGSHRAGPLELISALVRGREGVHV